jgi:hypothetical protein
MKPAYQAWIDAYEADLRSHCSNCTGKPIGVDGVHTRYVGDHDGVHTRGKCQVATDAMLKAFPELAQVRGFVFNSKGGLGAHWWLTTPEGEIVDPTVSQFEGGIAVYEPYDPEKHGPLPTGRCLNCGDYVYKSEQDTCSKECASEIWQSLTWRGSGQ